MTTDALSLTFTALADPTRRAILARLALGEATVNELAAPFALQLPAISKHLKTLERAGLVSKGRQAQWRPCRLEAAPLKEVADYVMDFRRFWEERYERLDEYLEELQAQRTQGAQSKSVSGAPRPRSRQHTTHTTKEKGHGRGK